MVVRWPRWAVAVLAAIGVLLAGAAGYAVRPQLSVSLDTSHAGQPTLTLKPRGWVVIREVAFSGNGKNAQEPYTSGAVVLPAAVSSQGHVAVSARGVAWGLFPFQWQTFVNVAPGPILATQPPYIVGKSNTLHLEWNQPLASVQVQGPQGTRWQLAAAHEAVDLYIPGSPGQVTRLALDVAGQKTSSRRVVMTVRHAPWLTANVNGETSSALSNRGPVDVQWNQPVRLTKNNQTALQWYPSIPGQWEAVTATRWRFTPESNWQQGTAYTLFLNQKGIVSTWGMPPEQDQVWQFMGAGPQSPVYWSVPNSPSTVYVVFHVGQSGVDPQVLALMQRQYLPFTTFLTSAAAKQSPDFWKRWVEYGGDLQDGTQSSAVRYTFSNMLTAWLQPLSLLRTLNWRTPVVLGSPPGGVYDSTLQMAAHAAGIQALVMWSAVLSPDGSLSTWNGKPLAGGEIVEVDWSNHVGPAVSKLLAEVQARHLHVGNLYDALAASLPKS